MVDLPGEKTIALTANGLLAVTNYRVQYFGYDTYVSIHLQHVSYIRFWRKTNDLYLKIGAFLSLAILAGGYFIYGIEGITTPLIVAGGVFAIFFLLYKNDTSKGIIIAGSAGRISVPTDKESEQDCFTFIDKLELAMKEIN